MNTFSLSPAECSLTLDNNKRFAGETGHHDNIKMFCVCVITCSLVDEPKT